MTKAPPAGQDGPAPDVGLLQRMVLALRQDEPILAEQLALQVLQSHPYSLLALQALSQAHLTQGRAEDAVAALKGRIARHNDPGLDSLYARALNIAGNQREAIAYLNRVTERPPPSSQLFLELANLSCSAGSVSEGIRVLKRGLCLLPDDPILVIGLGYLYLRQNDRVQARKLFEVAHAQIPKRHDALIALASVLALDGDFERAAGLYRQALGIRPHDLITEINLGKCILEAGHRSKGEAVLRSTAQRSKEVAGQVITTLAHASHGRFYLKVSDALNFLGLGPSKNGR